MITLFKSITGGADWGEFYNLATKTGPLGASVFLLYILVAWLSITNIITSIFIDQAMKLAKPDVDDRALEKRKADICMMHELSKIFRDIDIDHSQTISLDELRACLKDVRISSFLDMVGLDIADAETFYCLLVSQTGSSEIDVSSLVSGWLRMRGAASSIDLLSFQHQMMMFNKRFCKELSGCRQELEALKGDMQELAVLKRDSLVCQSTL